MPEIQTCGAKTMLPSRFGSNYYVVQCNLGPVHPGLDHAHEWGDRRVSWSDTSAPVIQDAN